MCRFELDQLHLLAHITFETVICAPFVQLHSMEGVLEELHGILVLHLSEDEISVLLQVVN